MERLETFETSYALPIVHGHYLLSHYTYSVEKVYNMIVRQCHTNNMSMGCPEIPPLFLA